MVYSFATYSDVHMICGRTLGRIKDTFRFCLVLKAGVVIRLFVFLVVYSFLDITCVWKMWVCSSHAVRKQGWSFGVCCDVLKIENDLVCFSLHTLKRTLEDFGCCLT